MVVESLAFGTRLQSLNVGCARHLPAVGLGKRLNASGSQAPHEEISTAWGVLSIELADICKLLTIVIC